jgi:hypothetical protein
MRCILSDTVTSGDKMNTRTKRLFRYFWIAGGLGVLVAISLYALGAFHHTRYFAVRVASVLCPEMIIGMAEPTSSGAVLLLLAWVFGTNFVLYGILGLLLGGAWMFGGAYINRKDNGRPG